LKITQDRQHFMTLKMINVIVTEIGYTVAVVFRRDSHHHHRTYHQEHIVSQTDL